MAGFKNFDAWNQAKKTIDNYKTGKIRNKIKEGNIYWVSIGINIGNEMHNDKPPYNRPVVVLKNNKNLNVFLGLPLTSKKKHGPYFFEFKDSHSVTQYASLMQIRAFDYRRVGKLKSKMENQDLEELKKRFVGLL